VIEFQLDSGSGLAIYLQITQQVKRAVRLGMLRPGDQLPTVREVVASLAINANTVLKAYRELEREGVVRSRHGVGTFVEEGPGDGVPVGEHPALRRDLRRWARRATDAGLGVETIAALFSVTLQEIEGHANAREGIA
jgi:GntR family transcriptional regulator